MRTCNFLQLGYLEFSAFMSTMFPSWIRSSKRTPCPPRFLATKTASCRFFSTSRRRASPSPDRAPAAERYLLRVAEQISPAYARHVGRKDFRSFRLLVGSPISCQLSSLWSEFKARFSGSAIAKNQKLKADG